MLRAEFNGLLSAHLSSRHADDWNVDPFLASLRQICPPPPEMDNPEKILQMRRDAIANTLDQHADALYEAKERALGSDDMNTLVRLLLLRSIDTHWVNHLTHMENLRTGVGLQAVGQRDPLTVYRTEGQSAFGELMRQMQRDVTHTLFHVTLAPEAPTQRAPAEVPTQTGGRAANRAPVSPMAAVAPSRTAVAPRAGRKIGRNSRCPCGSGRKYKRCCGANA
jgi:preprotein translocase subunit SecA